MVYLDKYGENTLSSDFQNFHATLLGTSKINFMSKKIFPTPSHLFRITRKRIFRQKKSVFSCRARKFFQLSKMYRRSMGLCIDIFSKFSTPQGEKLTKENFKLPQLPTWGKYMKFFSSKCTSWWLLFFLIFLKFFQWWVMFKNPKNCVFYVYFWNYGFYTKMNNEYFCFS